MASASSFPIPQTVADVALADVLRTVAQELNLIVELGERTQSALSLVLTGGPASAPIGVQELDSLVQHAHGLAAFVTALARACPAEWCTSPTDAAVALSLQAQKLRLSTLGAVTEPAPPSGAFELF